MSFSQFKGFTPELERRTASKDVSVILPQLILNNVAAFSLDEMDLKLC